MKMSDVIADFIGEMLSDGGGVAELQRKSLADRFVRTESNQLCDRDPLHTGAWLSG